MSVSYNLSRNYQFRRFWLVAAYKDEPQPHPGFMLCGQRWSHTVQFLNILCFLVAVQTIAHLGLSIGPVVI